MAIKFIDLYNEIAEQAWSMYDSDATDKDDFETALTSSIQKALSELYCGYDFPFRLKTMKLKTKINKSEYELPNGKIFTKTIDGKDKYSIKCDSTFLDYLDNYETLDPDDVQTGKCEYFYIKGDKLYIYPIPDDTYTIQIDYYTFIVGQNEDEEDIYTLKNENDVLDIPIKYETLFLNALKPLALAYSIADTTDENYAQYMQQYEKARSILIDCSFGVQYHKRITW